MELHNLKNNSKVALFSSAEKDITTENKKRVKKICKHLAENNITLLTGGCTGIIDFAAKELKSLGGKTHCFSPDHDEESHTSRYDNGSLKNYTKATFIDGFTQRSLAMVEACDAAIVIHGRTGTLCEALIAIEEAKPLHIFEKSGGVALDIRSILESINKKHRAPIYFY